MTTSKACNKCRRERPLANFQRQTRSADGHHAWCRECVARWQTRYRTTLTDRRAAMTDDQRWREAQTLTGGTYRCPTCRETLPVTAQWWYLRAGRAKGIHGECILCARERGNQATADRTARRRNTAR